MADETLSGEELIEIIIHHFEEDGRVPIDEIHIDWQADHVVLAGRVESDEELEIVEEILSEIPELTEYENNIWVDDTLALETADEDTDDTDLNLDGEDDFDTEEPAGGDE